MKLNVTGWVVALLVGAFALTSVNAEAADPSNKPSEPAYQAITGTVKEVHQAQDTIGRYQIHLTDDKGNPMTFNVGPETYIESVIVRSFKANMKVVGFVPQKTPMTMIYPPQYPVAAVLEEKEEFIKADRFDANGLSQDGNLKINVGSTTEVVLQDGKAYSGSLANRNLIVSYGVTTRSLPPQTTPSKIIVMFEKAVAPIAPVDQPTTRPAGGLEKPVLGTDVSKLAIVVNGTMTSAKAYQKSNGDVMVPARIALHNLGYKMVWDAREDRLFINDGISSLKAGENRYIFGRMVPMTLKSAPEIRNGSMYVPFEYFQKVLRIKNAYIFEGQLVLDNRPEVEKME